VDKAIRWEDFKVVLAASKEAWTLTEEVMTAVIECYKSLNMKSTG
jgi:hypothetical protein